MTASDDETNSADESTSDWADAEARTPSREGQGSGNGERPGNLHEGARMVNFEDEDGADATDAQTKSCQIKLDFDRKNLRKWIKKLEVRLEFCDTKSQWLKRVVLENLLPSDMQECMNDLLMKEKSEAGATIYKECKARLLLVHGPRPEEDFAKAQTMILTGLPSDGAKKLKEMLCKKSHTLDECCAAPGLSKLWRDMLPPIVKAGVASFDLTTHWDEALRTADAIFRAQQSNTPVPPAVAAVTTAVNEAAAALNYQTPADLDTSADASAFHAVNQLAVQLAAFGKTFNKRGKGQTRGQNRVKPRGAAGRPQPQQQPKPTQPHPDGPPDNACKIHLLHGKNAYYCANRATCPWRDIIAPRPTQ